MSYRVVFVGLACFLKRPDGSRLVLLPDGRNVGQIATHFANIAIEDGNVIDSAGWPNSTNDPNLQVTKFPIETDSIVTISGLNGAAAPDLDVSAQDSLLPRLPGFQIDPQQAKTIARFPISHGKLEARRIQLSAIVSRVSVDDHAGPVTITATPAQGGNACTLTVKDGTEIAVLNISDPSLPMAVAPDEKHFHIYSQLDVHNKTLKRLKTSPTAPPLNSNHPLLRSFQGTFPGAECSVTGCCP